MDECTIITPPTSRASGFPSLLHNDAYTFSLFPCLQPSGFRMTFGVSIGDVIAVSKLAHSVMVALSDARGAEASYKTAIELLRSLSSTIETVSLFISSSHESTQMQISDALKNGLRLHISACYSLMTQFLVRDMISGFYSTLRVNLICTSPE